MALLAAPIIVPPRSYADKYATDPDPWNGAYSLLLETDAVVPNRPLPAVLRDLMVYSSNDGAKVFLGLYKLPNGAFATRTIHRPSTYPPLPGVISPWDNQYFASTGDVIGGTGINTVVFPADAFNITAVTHVPAADAMAHEWEAVDDEEPVLGPYEDVDDTEPLQTRILIRVPPRYIPLVFNLRLSPRELWQRVGTVILADGNAASCAVFLNWIRIACIGLINPDDVNGPLLSPANSSGPDYNLLRPEVDEALHRHRWNIVLADLPALFTPPPAADPSLVHGLLTTFRDDRLAERNALAAERAIERDLNAAAAAAARATAAAPKLPSEAFPILIVRILEFCEVESEANLPDIWHKLAASPARYRRTLLETAVAERSRESNAATRVIPVITKAVIEMMTMCNFGARDTSDLSEGLHPLQVIHCAVGIAKATEALAKRYDAAQAHQAAPTFAEADALSPTTIPFPRSTVALDTGLKVFSLLLDVILGTNHRLAHFYRVVFLASNWPIAFNALNNYKERTKPPPVVEPLIMRQLQLYFVTFFNRVLPDAPPPLPRLDKLIEVILTDNYNQLPPIPAHYLTVISQLSPRAPVFPKPFASPAGATSVPAVGTPARSPTADPPVAGARTRAVVVTNPTRDVVFRDRFLASGCTLKDLAAHAPTTRTPEGETIALCLSYHLKHRCFENCGRQPTHKPLTVSERADFADFCNTHFVVPPPLAS